MKKHLLTIIASALIVLSLSSCELLALLQLGKEIEDYNNSITDYAVTINYTDKGKDGSSWVGVYDYGETVKLEIEATAKNGAIVYQWYKSDGVYTTGTKIDNAIFNYYEVPNKSESDAYYYCVATNTAKEGCSARTDGIHVKFTMIKTIDSNIDENTTFDSKYTYLIASDVHVYATLKIPAGTVIKFNPSCWIGTEGGGIINAVGTKATTETEQDKLIYFTSYRDNSVGITIPKSNGTPERADWEGIRIKGASGSKFVNCIFEYAGAEYNNETALKLENKSTVQDCIFKNNECKDTNDKVGALNILKEAEGSTVTGNVFYNNKIPLSCPVFFTVDTSNVFHLDILDNNGTVINTLKNDIQVISLWNNETLIPVTMGITEVPYCVFDTSADIVIKNALTIKEDVIFKFAQNCSLDICEDENGSLNGTGFILTSIRDDEHGGDTNGDEDISEPDDADWEGLWYRGPGFYNDLNMNEDVVLYNDDSKIEKDNPND